VAAIAPRGLTDAELATLEYLLTARMQNSEQLRRQLEGLQVVGDCFCGCATVDLMPDRSRTPAPRDFANRADPVVLAAASRPKSSAHPATLFLHVDADGWLRELEIVDDSGINTQRVFPPVESWKPPRTVEDFFPPWPSD
jgi:hypothetical protein